MGRSSGSTLRSRTSLLISLHPCQACRSLSCFAFKLPPSRVAGCRKDRPVAGSRCRNSDQEDTHGPCRHQPSRYGRHIEPRRRIDQLELAFASYGGHGAENTVVVPFSIAPLEHAARMIGGAPVATGAFVRRTSGLA